MIPEISITQHVAFFVTSLTAGTDNMPFPQDKFRNSKYFFTACLKGPKETPQKNFKVSYLAPSLFTAMSLPETYKHQPSTTIEDDLKAPMEARDIRKPCAEGEGEDEKAEELESARNNDAQEQDENDDSDEIGDWSDEEEGKIHDVCEEYNFVWSESSTGESEAYRGSIYIYGSAGQNQKNEPFRCIADFTWNTFVAQFTCIYRPETQTFTDFNAKRRTLDGGMEELDGVTICMWRESWSKEQGQWVRGRKEHRDDRNHLFLFVEMYFGIREGGMVTNLYGKKVVEVGEKESTVLTEGEKERLRLPSTWVR